MSTKTGHTPERMCVVCRQRKPKRELNRLVSTPRGDIEIDETGKQSGRGAYVCKSGECHELAFSRKRINRLAHALKIDPAHTTGKKMSTVERS